MLRTYLFPVFLLVDYTCRFLKIMKEIILNTSVSSKQAYTKVNDLYVAVQEGHINNVKRIVDELHDYRLSEEELQNRMYYENKNCVTQYDLIRVLLSAEKVELDNKAKILRYLLFDTAITCYLKNPNVDEQEDGKRRTEIFYIAINLKDSKIIEMLYDFWCGKIHWSGCSNNRTINDDIKNIKRVGVSLDEARKRCEDFDDLIKDQTLLTHIESLRTFNDFQHEIYSNLENQETISTNQSENKLKKIIRTVLGIYIKYSNIEMVRMSKSAQEEEEKIQELLSDENNKCDRALLYVMYKTYFRKLDYNVSLLILDNFFDLKAFIKSDLINQIECAIYYFIYRTKEDWKLYLPEHRTFVTKEVMGSSEGQNMLVKAKIPIEEINMAPVLLLEREKFVNILKQLQEQLATIEINRERKHTSNSMNFLTLLPILRDDYSLKKAITVIEAVINQRGKEETRALMIERALQITGEMLKTSSNSLHMSNETSALIESECSSIKTVLRDLRNDLSDKDCITISKRIDIAEKNMHVFDKVQNDLTIVNSGLKIVNDINKLILNKYLLQQGVGLTKNRYKEILSLQSFQEKEYLEEEKRNITNIQQYLSEMIENINTILSNKIINTVPKYFPAWKLTLQNIRKMDEKWQSISQSLPKKYDKHCFNDLNAIFNKINSYKTIFANLVEDWTSIKHVLILCVDQVEELNTFKGSIDEQNSIFDDMTIKNIQRIIEHIAELQKSSKSSQVVGKNYTFKGIKELRGMLKQAKNHESATCKHTLLPSLIIRKNILKKQLQALPLRQLVMRYNQDQIFRMVVDLILGDIFNIFNKYGLKDFTKKSTDIFAGYSLRNMQHHGNPMIEIIGQELDDQDFATALISKAILIANDSEIIEQFSSKFQIIHEKCM